MNARVADSDGENDRGPAIVLQLLKARRRAWIRTRKSYNVILVIIMRMGGGPVLGDIVGPERVMVCRIGTGLVLEHDSQAPL